MSLGVEISKVMLRVATEGLLYVCLWLLSSPWDPSCTQCGFYPLIPGCVSGKCPSSTLSKMCLDCFSSESSIHIFVNFKIRQIRCFVHSLCGDPCGSLFLI